MLRNTENRPDKGDDTRQRVDACLFSAVDNPEGDTPHWDLQRLHIEFKTTDGDDPFDDKKPDFEAKALKRKHTLEQITSYAAQVFKYQHRCFLFTIIILGKFGRILRWDRAGTVVTERFDYHAQPDILGDFFRRFSKLDEEAQGCDTSATLVEPDSVEYIQMHTKAKETLDFRDYARVYFEQSLDPARKLWRIRVNVQPPPAKNADAPGGQTHRSSTDPNQPTEKYFLVGTPHFCAGGMSGRGTRGYVALDPGTGEFVFLKDCWRVDLPGMEKEGEILQNLNKAKVRNVPRLLCHGDVHEQRG